MMDSDDEEYTLHNFTGPYLERPTAQRYHTGDNHPLLHAHDEDDDESSDQDVPESLLIEQPTVAATTTTEATSTRQNVTTQDRTMWRWTNVENMDDFFQRVYAYYQGKGMYCIVLGRLLNLLTLAFVIAFSSFLLGCVNYSDIPHRHRLSDVVVPQCYSKLPFSTWVFLIIFIAWWGWQAVRFVLDYSALKEMHNFYHYLLKVPDQDMQTVGWHQVLERLIDIRETNPNTSRAAPMRLDELTIASRIMRQDNYLVALFNKETLNITIPLPYLRNKHIFTRDLEWNLSFCVLSYVFDTRGQIRKRFLREKNRAVLAAGLRRRFIFMGLLNLVFAPFIFGYLVVYFFFRYFEEYHKNPGEIGSRTYTPFAKWKFREFNELPHLLRQRISSSYPSANKYIDQFPKEKTALMARFVAFVSGSIAGVLALFSLFDSEAPLSFEITTNGTVLFYLGLSSTIFAVSRGMIPDEHLIFEPDAMLKEVVEHTHYFPSEWRGKLHTDEVRAQFCTLFDYKVSIFLQELMSVVFTPLVLFFSLPQSAEGIVDFFREFTIHVEGLGYVCSFSQFDFARHGNVKYGAPVSTTHDDYFLSKQGKMEKSFLNFKANHPAWTADQSGSLYLSRLAEFQQQHFGGPSHLGFSTTSAAVHNEDHDPLGTSDLDVEHEAYEPAFQRHPPTFAPQNPAAPTAVSEEEVGPRKRTTGPGQPGEPSKDSAERRIPSNLGDSFAGPYNMAWQRNVDEEGAEESRSRGGMIGLLNEFYDLNNNPSV